MLRMGLTIVFLGFLQRIAIGTGTVLAMLLLVRFRMPRRSVVPVRPPVFDRRR